MRSLFAAAALLALAGPAVADINYAVETDTYRFGGTYATVSAETPAQCAHTCAGDSRCFAWSHSAVADAFATSCELKQNAGIVEPRPGYASGISVSHAAKFADVLVVEAVSHSELAGGRTYSPAPLSGGRNMTPVAPAQSVGIRRPRTVSNWSFAPGGGDNQRDYFPNSSESRPAYSSGPDRRPPPNRPSEQPEF